MASRPPRSAIPDEAPASVPQTAPPPPTYANSDHNFSLQMVLELQKSMGQATEAIKTLTNSVDGVKAKVDDLVNWKHKILGGAAVLGVVFTILGIGIGKFWDYFTIKAPTAISAPSSPQPTAPPPQALPAGK